MRILALGKFDALHRGHASLVRAAAQLSPQVSLIDLTGMAQVLGWPERPRMCDDQTREQILAHWSARYRCQLAAWPCDFARIRNFSPQEFLRFVHQQGFDGVVAGPDFRFGKDRVGSAKSLRELGAQQGLHVQIVPFEEDTHGPISTTRVRQALAEGNIPLASDLLGRAVLVCGSVQRGDGRGRLLGFPTANMQVSHLLPAGGVYAAHVTVGGRPFCAALNIGQLPTIGPDRPPTVEAHLLDYQGELYGVRLELSLAARLRDEQRFASLEALRGQIAADCQAVRQWVQV